MIKKLQLFANHSAIKFASVGVINTLLSICVIFGLKYLTNVSDVSANLAGYMIGLACSFVLNKRWTFKHTGDTLSSISKFILVFVVSYTFNVVTLLTLINLGANDYLAHLAGIPIYSTAFYFGSKYLVFAKNK